MNFDKYRDELLTITEDGKLCEMIYDIKCLMDNKCGDDEFLSEFIKWLGEENG